MAKKKMDLSKKQREELNGFFDFATKQAKGDADLLEKIGKTFAFLDEACKQEQSKILKNVKNLKKTR